MAGDSGAARLLRAARNDGRPFRGPPFGRPLGPLALAALVMLPRLASAQFGLLDDGLTLKTARELQGHWSSVLYLIPETGRFFPARWLFYCFIADTVGPWPRAFFVVNMLVLAGILAMLGRLVRLSGGGQAAATFACLAFALSGPAIETFYTLSKSESLQTAWIGLSLLATAASATHGRSVASRAGLAAASASALFIAYATKETTLVLVPITLAWLFLEWRWRSADRCARRFAATYLLTTVLGATAFGALRWQYAATTLAEGTYTRAYELSLATAGAAAFRITAWLLRDFLFLVPLVGVVFLRGGGPLGALRRPIFYALIWMTGWLALYLPWPATFAYYLLPFALGAAFLAGIVIRDLWVARATSRRVADVVLVSTAVLWCVSAINTYTDARIQLAVDRANAGLVDFLGMLPADTRVIVNMTPTNEYHFELPMHLAEIKGRRDIVTSGRPLSAGQLPSEPVVVTASMANEPVPTVRIALHEAGVRDDNAVLATLIDGGAEPIYRAAEHVPVLDVGVARLLCRLTTRPLVDPMYCPRDRAVVYRATFSYGWQAHRLVKSDGARR